MENNADKLNVETLNRYLDGELSPEEKALVQTRIDTDDKAKALLENVLIARDTIESLGVKNSVAKAFSRYKAQQVIPEPAKLIPLQRPGKLKKLLLVAASLLLLLVSYISYLFVSTNNENVFSEHYLAYNLPLPRNAAVENNKMDSLFTANDFRGYVTGFHAKENPTQKELFLAALCYLNMDKPAECIGLLLKLRENNKVLSEPLFEQESDYYLAMAYIKAGKIDAAQTVLTEISHNPDHMFNKKAQAMSDLSLYILSIKN